MAIYKPLSPEEQLKVDAWQARLNEFGEWRKMFNRLFWAAFIAQLFFLVTANVSGVLILGFICWILIICQLLCSTLVIRLLNKVRKEGLKRGQGNNKKD